MKRAARLLAISAVASSVCACRTVAPDRVRTFSAAVGTTRQQADNAFVAVNALTADAILDYAAAKPTLDDSNFLQVLDDESIARWDRTFAALESYSGRLAKLASGGSEKEYDDGLVGLSQELTLAGRDLEKERVVSSAPTAPAGVSAAFTRLSGLIVNAKAQADAVRIAEQADPGVQDVLDSMASLIGDSTTKGIRATVRSNWEQIKNKKSGEFLKAKTPAERRALAADYAKLMAQQKAQDLALTSLQASLKALAAAHHALARKADFELAQAVARLDAGLKQTMELYKRFDEARGGK